MAWLESVRSWRNEIAPGFSFCVVRYRMKKRVESGDFRVCAAHDLEPIFEKAFGIKPKELK